MVEDSPVTVDGWAPRNSDGRYRGEITLREAFAVSSNAAAVRLAEDAGRGAVIRAARDLGVTSTLDNHPSLALGTSGTTLLELTSAYAAVAGGRYPVTAYGAAGEGAAGSGLMNPRRDWPAMLDLLSTAAQLGTGRAGALAVPTFAKTGTTQDHRDALYIGFAGDLVVGVWVGNDNNAPMKGVTGGGLPARIWRDFMGAATKLEPGRAAAGIALYQERVRPVQARAEGQDAPQPANDPMDELEGWLPPEARRALDRVAEWFGEREGR